MALIDQHCTRTRSDTISDTVRSRPPDGHIAQPAVIIKLNWLVFILPVTAVGDHIVPDHRAPKQFNGRILLTDGQYSQTRYMERLGQAATLGKIGCLTELGKLSDNNFHPRPITPG